MAKYEDEIGQPDLTVHGAELLLVALVLLAPPGVVDLPHLEGTPGLLGQSVMAQLDPGLEQPRPGQAGDHPVAGRDGLLLLTRVGVGDTALLGAVVSVAWV